MIPDSTSQSKSLLPLLSLIFIILAAILLYQAYRVNSPLPVSDNAPIPAAAGTETPTALASSTPTPTTASTDTEATFASKDTAGKALVDKKVTTNVSTEADQIDRSLDDVTNNDPLSDSALSDQNLGL